MAQTYSTKQSEYRTYSTKGNIDDKDFEAMRAEIMPSKYGSLIPSTNGIPAKNKECYYEFNEEKGSGGTYGRKDLHTVEHYEFSGAPSSHNHRNQQYEHSGHLAIANSPHRVLNTTTTTTTTNRDLSHNIDELDTLLDDLQRDQERKLYKSGYASDTMESSSFDYRSTVPKSSGSSTISRIEKEAEWIPSNPNSVTREVNREVVTESHVVPGTLHSSPGTVCTKCHTSPVPGGGVPMNKVTTTVKTYTYEVPADMDPSTLPIPGVTSSSADNITDNYSTTSVVTTAEKYPVNQQHHHNHQLHQAQASDKYNTTNRNYIEERHENRTYANTHFNTSTPIKQPYGNDTTKVTTKTTEYTTASPGYPGNHGPPYPPKNSSTHMVPIDSSPHTKTYNYSATNYTTYNTATGGKPGPFPGGALHPPSPSPFPRTESPAPRMQDPPKRIDDLLADFPDAKTNATEDGIRYRPNPARGPDGEINGHLIKKEENILVHSENANNGTSFVPSKNIAGTAVYYPPDHEMFARREELAFQQAGGGYMKGKGKYKYEAKSSSKSKSSSTEVKAVPVCLPLCCAMPCAIM